MYKVLVTGGTKGIGLAVAQDLVAAGHTVVTCARDDKGTIRCDVTDMAQVARMRDEVGVIDVLVNNVGGAITAPFLKIDENAWDDQFRLNVKSTWNCIHAFLPGMLEQKQGRIINIASTAGEHGYRYISAYAAAKHALIGLTKSLALEVAGKGVTVNAVCPSFVDTPMLRDSFELTAAKTGKTADEIRHALQSRNPQGRFVTPQEVAAAVRFLIETPAVNGQAITLCGGETAG